jgi:hypothetical protein
MEDGTLMRAERFYADGSRGGAPIAAGVDSFSVSLVFTDGSEAPSADATDADEDNDYDDIVSVRLRLRLRGDSMTVAARRNGEAPVKVFDWRFSPRNLIYERNRRR